MNNREILEDFVNNEDTEYCYDWHGFDYKIILPCIEQLLKNENNLQSKIDKANEILNRPQFEKDNIPCNCEEDIKELKDVLKEVENVENN